MANSTGNLVYERPYHRCEKDLKFSTFASDYIGRQYKSFDNINKEIKNGDIPLSSYTLMRREAILNASQKPVITNWTIVSGKELKSIILLNSLKPNKPNREQ